MKLVTNMEPEPVSNCIQCDFVQHLKFVYHICIVYLYYVFVYLYIDASKIRSAFSCVTYSPHTPNTPQPQLVCIIRSSWAFCPKLSSIAHISGLVL